MSRIATRVWFVAALACALMWLSTVRPCPCPPATSGPCTKGCCGSRHADAMAKGCSCQAAFRLDPGVRAPVPNWTDAPAEAALPMLVSGETLLPAAGLEYRPRADPGRTRGCVERILEAGLFSQAPPEA